MKAKADQITRALDSADASVRLFLLHGPDQSGSRGLADRLAKRMGDRAERIDLSGAVLKLDPARLADEAAAISLFGDPRWILVDAAGEEALPAVEALLTAAEAGNPVVFLAGTLRRDSKLLKLIEAASAAMAHASYVPVGDQAAKLAVGMARELGLRADPDVAAMLAQGTGGDRAVLARELEKFADYLDASPERPRDLTHQALATLGASIEEEDFAPLTSAALSGRLVETADLLGRHATLDGIPLLRAVARRLALLAQLRSQVDQGDSIARVLGTQGKAIFWKDQPEIQRQLGLWTSAELATAVERIGQAERRLKTGGAIGPVDIAQVMLSVARQAARRR